jgi:hypothetical protein
MSKSTGIFSKILTTLVGGLQHQHDTEPTVPTDNSIVAESSSGTKQLKNGVEIHHRLTNPITAATDDNGGLPPLKKRRRTLIIEEEKQFAEYEKSLEDGVKEWKKSLDLGYEFDHLEKWPQPQGEDRCVLPENHLSTQAMCVHFYL